MGVKTLSVYTTKLSHNSAITVCGHGRLGYSRKKTERDGWSHGISWGQWIKSKWNFWLGLKNEISRWKNHALFPGVIFGQSFVLSRIQKFFSKKYAFLNPTCLNFFVEQPKLARWFTIAIFCLKFMELYISTCATSNNLMLWSNSILQLDIAS